MTSEPPATVDEYVSRLPEDVQPAVQKLREVIKAAAPGVEERIGYQMPAYYLNGVLIYFGVNKDYIGMYPLTDELKAAFAELSAHKGTKASLHFPLDQPIPYDLIEKMVKFRAAENLSKPLRRRRK